MSHVYLLHRRIQIRLSCWEGRRNLNVEPQLANSLFQRLLDPSFMFIMQSFMVIFGSSFRACGRSHFYPTAEKVFTRVLHLLAKLFIIKALFLDRLYGLFEVHVFNRERCLKEFLIEPVERSPEEKHNIRSTYKYFIYDI